MKGDFFSETVICMVSVSRCVSEVVAALNNRLDINFPLSAVEVIETKRRFYQVARLPNVVGAVD